MRRMLSLIYPFWVRTTLALLTLRICEWSLALKSQSFPDSTVLVLATGIGQDIVMASAAAIIAALIQGIWPRPHRIVPEVFLAFFLLISALLSHYFVSSLALLGSDLFSYTTQDMILTVGASATFHWTHLLLYLLPQLIFWVGRSWHRNTTPYRSVPAITLMVLVLALGLSWMFVPSLSGSARNWAQNKSWHMILSVKSMGHNKPVPEDPGYKKYYRNIHEVNTLYPRFSELNKDSVKLVLVLIEGFGTDFMKGGRFQGYAPFLDSLSQHSLYWPNVLSTTGRTFGILPSILGGLPYAFDGFLELGPLYPPHYSLISFARSNAQTTRYFYPGSRGFDGQDLFMEYQGVDEFYDESDFGSAYRKIPTNKEGFTWGYPDQELYRFYLSKTGMAGIDILLTLTTHEPFILPTEEWNNRFREYQRSRGLKTSIELEKNVLSTIFYADQSLKWLFNEFKKKKEFDHVVFMITGDHRVIPLDMDYEIERFHVPLIIYSPALITPQKFDHIQTHSDVYPALLSFMGYTKSWDLPDTVFSLGRGLDTLTGFNSSLAQGLMVNKGDFKHYVSGKYWYSRGNTYTLDPYLKPQRVRSKSLEDSLGKELQLFKTRMEKLINDSLLIPQVMTGVKTGLLDLYSFTEAENIWFSSNGLNARNVDSLFFYARELAFEPSKRKYARICLKKILNVSPDYTDVRILLGRTYAWDGIYEDAEIELRKALKRSPGYYDVYLALADLLRWKGKLQAAKAVLDSGLRVLPRRTDLLEKRSQL